MTSRPLALLLLTLAVGASVAAAATAARTGPARPSQAKIVALPSSATIPPSGVLPPVGKATIDMNVAIGEKEGAWVVVTGAKEISAGLEPPTFNGLQASLAWGHFVRFGPRSIPDALVPWDGNSRNPEMPNQPIYVRVDIPYGTTAGVYRTTLSVTADDVATPIPLTVNVAPVTLPQPGRNAGSIPTSFHVSGESYVNKVDAVYHLASNDEREKVNASLFAFLASYRISPAGYGFGEPDSPSGYTSSKKWWLDSAGNMQNEMTAAGPGYPAMRIPISSNRTSARNYIAGLSPAKPDTWCEYLGAVHKFWADHGWLSGSVVPYLYAQDEPGLEGQRLVAQQSAVAHRCFPGSKVLMTGNPSPNGANSFLFDNKGGDDVDIFTVIHYRFYGSFTVPEMVKAHQSRERQQYTAIQLAHKRGKWIWTYTYTGVPGVPTFDATEPLSNPRMFLLWNALEGTDGVLYGEGTTSYGPTNPLDALDKNGQFVLVYPGKDAPIPSARLEQIRDGIEDWEILNIVRQKKGAGAVRTILGQAGLFSADAAGVKLGCNVNCDVKSETKFSWPIWSHDGTTAGRIEAAKKQALQLAG